MRINVNERKAPGKAASLETVIRPQAQAANPSSALTLFKVLVGLQMFLSSRWIRVFKDKSSEKKKIRKYNDV